jgi:hypothetical protein
MVSPIHLKTHLVVMKTLIAGIAALALIATASAGKFRGVWFWNVSSVPSLVDGKTITSPYSSSLVVGDSAKEDETLAFFVLHDVKRLYGSYQNRPVSEPSVIAAWNRKLHCSGVESQILIDGTNVHLVDFLPDLLDKIDDRFIDFNASFPSDPAAHFKAIHLDVEPQGSVPWPGGTAAVKRGLLTDLLNVYIGVRAHLDVHGHAATPIYADIPFTWDKIPGSIGWADAADRDAWFTAVGNAVDGLSLMTFSKDTVSGLEIATEYERSGSLDQRARIGIQPKIFGSGIWPDYPTFETVMVALEASIGTNEATDIENYAFWRHSIAATTPDVAPIYRGLYFYRNPSVPGAIDHPFGSIDVVGDATAEDEMLDWLTTFGIRRLFGEYWAEPRDYPATIAAWNTKLARRCIQSQLYLRGQSVQAEDFVSDVTTYITYNLVSFNAAYAATPAAQFKGLRLNFDPYNQSSWATITPAQRRMLLIHQRNAYIAVRNHLVALGVGDFPVHADLIHGLNDMSFIGWIDEADRLAWYDSVMSVVDTVTIKTNGITFSTIEDEMSYERSIIAPSRLRLGMYSHTTTNPWPTLSAFEDMLLEWEGLSSTATLLAADIDSYAIWRHSINAGGNIVHVYNEAFATGAEIAKPPGGGVVVVFDGEYGYTYYVRTAITPSGARQGEILATHTQTTLPHREIKLSLPQDGDTRFYVIERRPSF